MNNQEILNRLEKLEKAMQLIEDLKKIAIDTNEQVWEQVESNTLSLNSLKQKLRVMGCEIDRFK
ncbi:MAG: hypothetical protein QNJ70_23595 [Xenococcaceae cyanobacterium MO_207.B15]|nr:hypothetical protein [Xenococcaceae cyanobacterium MO_207.B15]MDJ0744563.1 hypothetical protein [Xenococcaceae cyanobacterium MO_167.B27]